MLTADFDELYQKHFAEIYRHCYRIVRNKEDAEELANETFVKAHFHRNQFNAQKGNFRGWIFTIATHLAFDFLDSAAQKRQRQTISLDDLVYSENDESQSNAHSEHTQLLKFIDDCLDRLNEKERLAVSLRHLQDFTLQEIAKILGLKSHTAVRKRIIAGEKKMKKCLERKGINDYLS